VADKTQAGRSPFDRKHEITIEVDEAMLTRVTDETLAVWWHVAQANPADGFADSTPAELAEQIGREIIRRWLKDIPPELHHHQGRHYYWKVASDLGNWSGPDRSFVPHEPVADPALVMQALGDAAVFARSSAADSEQANRYERLLSQMQAAGDSPDPEAGRG
jgi:hypothetical protein